MINYDDVIDRYYAEWELQDICSGEEDRDWLMKCINEAPEIEVEPVKHGEWIAEGKHPFSPECSVCHKHGVQFAPVNYCSNCGARMDGE